MSPRVKAILNDVANKHGVTVPEILGRAIERRVSHPRADALRLIRALRHPNGKPVFSYPAIGQMFGRDHSTIILGVRKGRELFGVPFTPDNDPEEGRL